MGSPSLDTEETPEQGPAEFSIDENVPPESNVTQPIPSTEPNIPNRESPSTNKVKKDQKSKMRSIGSPSLVTEDIPEQGSTEFPIDENLPLDLNVAHPTPSQEPTVSDRGFEHTKKAKKIKRSKKRAVVSPFMGAEETPEQVLAIDGTEPLDVNVTQPNPSTEPNMLDWGFSSTKETKKSKRSAKKDLEIDKCDTASGTEIVPEQTPAPEVNVDSNQDETSEAFQSPTATDVETSTKPESKSVEKPAVAARLDTSVIGSGVLQRRLSKKDKKRKEKKADISNEWADVEYEGGSGSINQSQYDISIEEQAQPPAIYSTEQQASMDAPQQFQDTPPRSPRLPNNQGVGTDNNSVQTSPVQRETSITRDSAVYISDSPLVPENPLVNYAIRDSGYQDIEASQLIQSDSMLAGKSTDQQNAQDLMTNPLVTEITAHKTTDEKTHPNLQDSENTSENRLNISVEVDPAYDVSISRPNLKRERSRTTSRAARDNDETVPSDSSQDLSNVQTTGSTFDDPREPSPVSSTTKERSSVLFQSSPSTREDVFQSLPAIKESLIYQPLEKDSSGHDGASETREDVIRQPFENHSSVHEGTEHISQPLENDSSRHDRTSPTREDLIHQHLENDSSVHEGTELISQPVDNDSSGDEKTSPTSEDLIHQLFENPSLVHEGTEFIGQPLENDSSVYEGTGPISQPMDTDRSVHDGTSPSIREGFFRQPLEEDSSVHDGTSP